MENGREHRMAPLICRQRFGGPVDAAVTVHQAPIKLLRQWINFDTLLV
jgi:hypothetical protein